MKLLVILIGILVTLIGLLPLLIEQQILPEILSFIPVAGLFYQVVSMVLGILTVYYGFKTE